jgi:hypothetical protein
VKLRYMHGQVDPTIPMFEVTLNGGPADGQTVKTQWPDIVFLEQTISNGKGENRWHEYGDDGRYHGVREVTFEIDEKGSHQV